MCDVNIATGEVTQFEHEILLSGRIPWKLVRAYSSLQRQPSVVGFGWKLNLGTAVRRLNTQLELIVDGEPSATLPLPQPGSVLKDDASNLEVKRTDTALTVTNAEGTTYIFPNREPFPAVVGVMAVRDYYGNTLHYGYDLQGRLSTIIDSMQRRLTFQYDARGRLSRITLPKRNRAEELWELIRYAYDEHDDLVAVLDPAGHATRYQYADHLLRA